MQISNSKLCESSKCRVYSAVNHFAVAWLGYSLHIFGYCGQLGIIKDDWIIQVSGLPVHVVCFNEPGLSLPFLGMWPGPLALGKLAAFRLKLGISNSI